MILRPESQKAYLLQLQKSELSGCELSAKQLVLFYRPMRKFLLFVFTLFFYCSSFAQIGRPQAFDFLNLSPSARVAALGGMQVSGAADSNAVITASNWFINPANQSGSAGQQLSLSYQPYYADVDYATLSYTRPAAAAGSWGIGVSYLSYGEMDSYDLTGQLLGTFSSQEYALLINRTHQSGPFRMGVNAKFVASDIAGFGASALLFDLGGMFVHPRQDLSIGLSINNLGVLLDDYSSFTQSRLPSDVRLGLAFKPRYMPFRLYLSGYYLLFHNQAYFSADNNEMPGYVNRILRHMSLGGELILGQKFFVLFGYNHLKGNTLQMEQFTGGAGLSLGLSLRLRFLQLDFSRAFYHVAGGVSHFTLTTDLEKFNFKRN